MLWIVAAVACFWGYYFLSVDASSKRVRIIDSFIRTDERYYKMGGELPPDILKKLPANPSLGLVIAGCSFLLFPLLFRLIFGLMPLELLRLKASRIEIEGLDSSPGRFGTLAINVENIKRLDETSREASTEGALSFLRSLTTASRQISEKIYQRAGVYLLIGVLVAFSGLAFFYYQQGAASIATLPDAVEPTTAKTSADFKESVLHTLPRFGILFFIETIAFFFLRQYRTAMDEYRYFEAIKRRREENLVLLSLLAAPNAIDLSKLPQKTSLYSDGTTLAQGESTELLESRKLTKDETAVLEKIVDALTKIKP